MGEPTRSRGGADTDASGAPSSAQGAVAELHSKRRKWHGKARACGAEGLAGRPKADSGTHREETTHRTALGCLVLFCVE